ncbi:MAG TPA: HAMP domain-containing sensor histidine kinase [Polyangiaceae bacterium]|nr:HAMP domain-containing sensor histidine kinase [Polyangiaceae bacterium]
MSPPLKKPSSTTSKVSQPNLARTSESSWVEASSSEHGAPEGINAFLLRLADRLGEAIPLEEAIEFAVSALAAQLPNCRVELQARPADSEEPASIATGTGAGQTLQAGYPSSTQLLERCSWPLSEAPDSKCLVIMLPELRSLHDVSVALDLGTYVAQWLRLATRTEHLRVRVAQQTDEVLEARQRVIQAEKLSGYAQFVASSLHDMNNPLTAVIAYSDYLGRKFAQQSGLDADDQERLGRIREAAQAALRQTRRLVEYACPARSPREQVNISDVIRRALVLCEHEFVRARLDVRLNAEDNLSTLSGHAEQLTQMFINLFTNAAQAARSADAWLRIDACEMQECRQLTVTVRDNGTGINPSDLDHVFDAFYTTKSGCGSGLGLAIVRDIVKHHGGNISVASSPNVETAFTIVLPCGDDNQGTQAH